MSEPSLVFKTSTYDKSLSGCNLRQCDFLFIGDAVDDRGEAVNTELASKAKRVVRLSFCDQKLVVDGQDSSAKKLAGMLNAKSIVRIESTTLGLAEILRVLQAVKEAKISELEFCYVEPKEYSNHQSMVDGILSPREFELTTNNVFSGLQGFNNEFREDQKASHVFFLGYESSRLQQALEQRGEFPASGYHRYFVIGVPAFSPGWETNVLANHVTILERLGESSAIRYCAANSISEAYLLLWDLYRSIGSEESIFWVSPFGTKPHTVATALFLLETKGSLANSSLFYDHPVRTGKRSKEVSKFHFVTISGL